MFRINHFRALMRKNWITWKRTPIESSLEILVSVFLMVVLAIARLFIVPKSISSQGLQNLKHTLYPIASPSATGEWTLDSSTQVLTQADKQMQSLMRHTNFTNWGQTYLPMMDPLGPYLFFPQHCYGSEEDKFASPIIGYVQTGSQFEQDLILQLELLFENQKKLSGTNASVESKLQDFQKTIEDLAMNGDALKAESFKDGHQELAVTQLGNFTLQSFKNHKEFDLYIQDPRYGSEEMPGICFGFQASESLDKRSYDLELMFNDQMPARYISLPNQRLPASLPTQFLPLFNDYVLYSWNGFGYMQNWAANTILKRHTTPDASIVCVTVPFQSKDFIKDDFEFLLRIGLTSIIFLIYMPPMYRTVYRIVQEKESKAKETMLMMGMSQMSYWCSWFCYYTVVNTLITTLSWLILAFVIFKHSNVLLVWLVLWLFGQSLFGMILVAQSMFTRARAAAYVTTSLYFGLALLESLIQSPTTGIWSKVMASLSPTVALSQTINVLVVFETSGLGSHFFNMQVWYMNYSIRLGLLMICVDSVIWYVLGAYLEVALPQPYGKRRGCFGRYKDLRAKEIISSNDFGECFEATPQDVANRECLVVQGLKKTYENGFQAVNNLCCKMFKDQIFCLLGHNGAGKTSTISILTGLIEPSSFAKLQVFGVEIMSQEHRQFLGVCPQHDILFELLTPKEHLEMFYEFKSSQGERDREICEMIKDVGLDEKVNTVAGQLSGGNKRKLSVAIALIGGSKFVLLDEPTSGMDISARHQLWSMLRKHKQGRIILMTTHYMDEADVLGDRIGIMHSGKLTCIGSSLFLKTKFGVGYNLCVSKNGNGLKKFVADYFGEEVNCLSETETQIVYQLLHDQSPRFEKFFKELDQKSELAESYTLSITTLEDIFLKIGYLEDPLAPQQKTQIELSPEIKIQGKDNTFMNNLKGVLFKRKSVIRRNRRQQSKEVFYPAFIMFYAIVVGQFIPVQRSDSKILSPSHIAANQHLAVGQLILNDNWLLEIVENPFEQFEAKIERKQKLFSEFALKLLTKLQSKQSTKKVPNRSNEPILQLLGQQFKLDHVAQSPKFSDVVFDLGRQLSDPHLYAGVELVSSKENQYQFIAHVNLTSQEVAAIYPQVMYETILKAATGDSQFEFKVKSTPYPITAKLNQFTKTTDSGRMVFLTAVAQACIITLICSSYVLERTNGLKHFQTIAGMQLGAYWAANFIFDLITMEVTAVTTCLLFYYYQLPYYSAQISFLLYPFAVLPYTYVMSFCFASEAQSQSVVMFLIFMSILTLSTVGFVLRSVEGFEEGSDMLHWCFRMVNPSYCLGSSIYLNTSADLLASARATKGIYLSDDQWALINVTGDILCLILHAIFWPIVLYFIESRKNYKPNDRPISQADAIKVENFRKVFKHHKLCERTGKKVVAVNNLCFTVRYGESFCLLGVNGAGKSTTFKALTGEVQPSCGKIALAGHQSDASQFGYCPQQNLIFDTMTVEEHLLYFAAIRGVPKHQRVVAVDKVIQDLGLHRNKEAGTLSGGNKRKLCVAIAIISNTSIVLLDEPSAGMDPDSRKLMWNVVKQIMKRERSAVFFTTHSIEEAEALSTKIGIMVKGGEFKCIGTSQEIKGKFGFGYVIDCKIALLGSENQLLTYLCHNFGQVDCLERQGTFIRLLLPKNNFNVSFGHIFGVMEKYKSQKLILEYSVTQSTLEQVFQTFANIQENEQVTHWRLGDDQKLIQF